MKYLLIICGLILITSCKAEKLQPEKPAFLLGNWIRTNDKDSVVTYENWQDNFSGIGLTLKGKDTTFYEEMKIISKNDTLYLEVSAVNETPTPFKFTQQTDTSFVCENPQNQFPKKITYWLENNLLKATVSNNNFSIDFIFKNLQKH